jgi:hypothetical protein
MCVQVFWWQAAHVKKSKITDFVRNCMNLMFLDRQNSGYNLVLCKFKSETLQKRFKSGKVKVRNES